jgi:hypothetical protein
LLQNHAHHDGRCAGLLDVYSSGAYFTGWRQRIRFPLLDDGPPPVVPATRWLLTTGWMLSQCASCSRTTGKRLPDPFVCTYCRRSAAAKRSRVAASASSMSSQQA